MFALCLPANIVSIILGALLFKGMLAGIQNTLLMLVFALITIVAQMLYIMHRGFRPVAGPLSFVILVLSIFLLRHSVGNFPIFETNLIAILGAIVLFQIIKLPIG